MLHRYCGSTAPPDLTSTGEVMTIVFVTDAYVGREGFMASYITLNASHGQYKMCKV